VKIVGIGCHRQEALFNPHAATAPGLLVEGACSVGGSRSTGRIHCLLA
jgi:hypothetical protein